VAWPGPTCRWLKASWSVFFLRRNPRGKRVAPVQASWRGFFANIFFSFFLSFYILFLSFLSNFFPSSSLFQSLPKAPLAAAGEESPPPSRSTSCLGHLVRLPPQDSEELLEGGVRQRGGRRFPIGKIQWHMMGRSYAIAIRGRKLQGGYPGVR
jgi:hypothetical protein